MSNKLEDVEYIDGSFLFKRKEYCQKNVSFQECVLAAQREILLSEMSLTHKALSENKLESLMVKKDERGLVTTVGRWDYDTVKSIFGVESLPVLIKDSRTAKLYMLQAHTGKDNLNHRSVSDTLARS